MQWGGKLLEVLSNTSESIVCTLKVSYAYLQYAKTTLSIYSLGQINVYHQSYYVSEAISMADRVVVLTRRPARIRSVHDITLAGTPMQRRGDPAFREYFEAIWKELDVHVQ